MSDEEKRQNSATRRRALVNYLFVLFCAAFLLVMLSFVRQVRQSSATISELSQTSSSALANAQRLQEENEELRQKVSELQEKADSLQSTLDMTATDANAYKNRVTELQTQVSELKGEIEKTKDSDQGVLSELELKLDAYRLLAKLLTQTGESGAAEVRRQLEPLKEYLDPDAKAAYENFRLPEIPDGQ
jgi:uncharacterized coiled-coil DUF342 family protein